MQLYPGQTPSPLQCNPQERPAVFGCHPLDIMMDKISILQEVCAVSLQKAIEDPCMENISLGTKDKRILIPLKVYGNLKVILLHGRPLSAGIVYSKGCPGQ